MNDIGTPLPPQSIDAEQAILGGLLADNAAYDRIVDVLSQEAFYRKSHRDIYAAISTLIEENKPADAVTVCERLGRALEDVGGKEYVHSLALNHPSAANIRRYSEIVVDRFVKRRLIALCNETAETAYREQHHPAQQLVENAEAMLIALTQRKSRGARMMADILPGVIERVDELYSRDDKRAVTGLPSGFVDLDQKTAGFQPGDLIIIAARPSMGKTSLGMNIAEHVAINEKKAVAVFSLEMSDEQLGLRSLGSVGRIDQHALRTGTFPEDDWHKVTVAAGKLSEAKIVVEETFDLSPAVMRAKARRLKREHPDLALILVDYLQLMDTPSERRVDQLSEISRGLKRIAKELRLPVIALSQLNRQVEARPNKRPQMSDIRDSGAIEQDADIVLFLYREEVYEPETEAKGIAELIIGKHRNGPIGTLYLTWNGAHTRFDNYLGDRPLSRPAASRRIAVRNFEDYKSKASGDS